MKNVSKETRIVHGTESVHTTTMDHVPPIHMTSTFKFKNTDFGAGMFKGEQEGYIYTRLSNPTVDLFQEKMALIEEGEAAQATSSGMSAIAAVGLSLLKTGDNLVGCGTIYGGTYALFTNHFPDLGIESRLLSPGEGNRVESIEKKIDGKTRFLFMETPANPNLDILDIALWAKAAAKHRLPLVVDNTFASPYLQNPLRLGADIVVHSATKYIGGHGDIVGGVIVGTKKMIAHIREAYTVHFGPVMSPFNAWLFSRGLKTLALRMERHSENALKIARWLESHPKVHKVYYPGLVSHPGHEIAKKQMRKFGGMIAFEINGGIQAGKTLLDNLKLCCLAVSLGDVQTLIQHPASMTHATYSAQDLKKAGISDGLIRLSAGIESAKDIIADLEMGLAII